MSQTWLSHFTFTFHCHALGREMATHSSVLAWRIPRMAEPAGLPSMGSHKVGHDWSDLAAAAADYTIHGILQARILEWVAYPFSSGSSWPRNWTRVSCIAGGFFTSWATREALRIWEKVYIGKLVRSVCKYFKCDLVENWIYVRWKGWWEVVKFWICSEGLF